MQIQLDEEDVTELGAVVDSISSPQELFDVLNEQLTMVQDLSEEIRDKGIALQHSEEARYNQQGSGDTLLANSC